MSTGDVVNSVLVSFYMGFLEMEVYEVEFGVALQDISFLYDPAQHKWLTTKSQTISLLKKPVKEQFLTKLAICPSWKG
jgi:hypothetical protein